MKKYTYISVYDNSGCKDPPEKAKDFMAFWQDKLDLIPQEYIDSATIEIRADDEWGEIVLKVNVGYLRPETDEEERGRELEEQLREDAIRRKELAQLERLRTKYEG